MNAGKLDQRVALLKPTYGTSQQSAQGDATYTAVDTVWAAVKAMSGSEVLAAGSIGSQVTYEVEMRFRPDVTPKYRIQWTPYRGVAKRLEVHVVQVGDRADGSMTLLCGVVE